MEEKEISIFDYLPKVLPILDIIFIVWIAMNSPRPWVTTPIHLAMPAAGFTALILFRERGRLGFYVTGIATALPVFFLNFWGSETCPTWLTEFSFIGGGLLLANTTLDRIAVFIFVLITTIPPLLVSGIHHQFLISLVMGEFAVWFLLERGKVFMDLQKKQIQKQKLLVEEKQKEILDSIQYAKRIQQSLLPTEKYIEKSLKKLSGDARK